MSVFIYYFWKWWWGNKKYLHIGQGFANSFIQSQQKRLVIRLIGWNSQVENTKSKCDNSKLEDYEALDTPFPMEIWIKKTNWQNTPVREKKKKKKGFCIPGESKTECIKSQTRNLWHPSTLSLGFYTPTPHYIQYIWEDTSNSYLLPETGKSNVLQLTLREDDQGTSFCLSCIQLLIRTRLLAEDL